LPSRKAAAAPSATAKESGNLVGADTRREAQQERREEPPRQLAVDRSRDETVVGLRQALGEEQPGLPEIPGGVDVDPGVASDAKNPRPTLLGEPPHAAGERAVALADACLEGRQDRRGAEEDPGVERVVLRELLPDRRDPLTVDRDLRRLLSVDEGAAIHPEVDGEHELALLEPLPEQAPQDRRIEDVVGHEQHEVPVQDVASGEERAGVSRLPGLVAQRADREVAPERELRQERLDARGPATRYHEELAQPSLRGGDDCALEERQAENRDERLEAASTSQAAAAAGGEDHAARRRRDLLSDRVVAAAIVTVARRPRRAPLSA
jgi:hypothetical protein